MIRTLWAVLDAIRGLSHITVAFNITCGDTYTIHHATPVDEHCDDARWMCDDHLADFAELAAGLVAGGHSVEDARNHAMAALYAEEAELRVHGDET